MPIQRLLGPPHAVTPTARNQVLYSVELNVVPSPPWRAAFLRPPARLVSAQYTPELGRVGRSRATVHFRTAPHRARFWLRRIDRWIAYANSLVEK